MRILESYTSDAAATQTRRADSPGNAGLRGETTRAARGDDVRWSQFAGKLLETGSADPPERSERLARLAADYASGSYSVDAATLSRSIVEGTLAGS